MRSRRVNEINRMSQSQFEIEIEAERIIAEGPITYSTALARLEARLEVSPRYGRSHSRPISLETLTGYNPVARQTDKPRDLSDIVSVLGRSVVDALLSTETIGDAAALCGMSRATLFNRLKDCRTQLRGS